MLGFFSGRHQVCFQCHEPGSDVKTLAEHMCSTHINWHVDLDYLPQCTVIRVVFGPTAQTSGKRRCQRLVFIGGDGDGDDDDDDDNYDMYGDDGDNNDVNDDLDHEDDDDMFHDPHPGTLPYQYEPLLLPPHGVAMCVSPGQTDPKSIHYTYTV
jgi:hypothetical protein